MAFEGIPLITGGTIRQIMLPAQICRTGSDKFCLVRMSPISVVAMDEIRKVIDDVPYLR